MAELKLNSRSIDSIQLSTYEAVCRIAMASEVPFLIVGASARDLVMHHGYGAAIQRATRDVDIAIQVSDWSAFDTMCDSLTKEGFSKTDAPHRLMSSIGIPLDIIPFGPIENETGKIGWPPQGDFEMGVAGFQEAWEHADKVIIDQDPVLILPVASPEGLALLKLVAWSERDAQTRRKDASDLDYLMTHYDEIPGHTESFYEHYPDLLDIYDWETRLCGAHLLGVNTARIARTSTLSFLRGLLTDHQVSRLESDGRFNSKPGGHELLAAFLNGFRADLSGQQ